MSVRCEPHNTKIHATRADVRIQYFAQTDPQMRRTKRTAGGSEFVLLVVCSHILLRHVTQEWLSCPLDTSVQNLTSTAVFANTAEEPNAGILQLVVVCPLPFSTLGQSLLGANKTKDAQREARHKRTHRHTVTLGAPRPPEPKKKYRGSTAPLTSHRFRLEWSCTC